MNNYPTVVIDEDFVLTLFQNSTFRQQLDLAISCTTSLKSPDTIQSCDQQFTLIIEEISGILLQDREASDNRIYQKLKGDLRNLYKQMGKLQSSISQLHDSSSVQTSKFDESPKQLSVDPFLQDDNFFDLPSIKRTIKSLRQRVNVISENSCVLFDSAQTTKQSNIRESAIQQMLNSTLNQMEQKFGRRLQLLEEITNKRLQKQHKTINNILSTLNDFNGSAKTAAALSNSKSATKLKGFFGFG